MRVAGEFNRRSAPVASRAAPPAQCSRARSVPPGTHSDAPRRLSWPILLATMRRYFLTTTRSDDRQSHPRSGGASPETIPRRSGEWRPAAAARTAPREVRDPVPQARSLGADKLPSAPVPLPETAARIPGRKSPRWSAERGPGRTGAWWSRLARATKIKSAPVGAPLTPRSGGNGIAAVAKVTSGAARRSLGEGGTKRRDKPGRANAPRERRGLRCLTS
jgi:hypothetical protein